MGSCAGIAFENPSDPKTADGCHEEHQHLAERDGVVEFKHDRDRGNPEAEQLAEPAHGLKNGTHDLTRDDCRRRVWTNPSLVPSGYRRAAGPDSVRTAAEMRHLLRNRGRSQACQIVVGQPAQADHASFGPDPPAEP